MKVAGLISSMFLKTAQVYVMLNVLDRQVPVIIGPISKGKSRSVFYFLGLQIRLMMSMRYLDRIIVIKIVSTCVIKHQIALIIQKFWCFLSFCV